MTTELRGRTDWQLSRDSEGHRTYKLTLYVESDDPLDGPAQVLGNTPFLPEYGDYWAFGNDIDAWAWCRWDAEVTQRVTNEPAYWWDCVLTFSTKPSEEGETKSCKEAQIDDPILQPPKINGGFVKNKEEATHDRFGKPILNSAHEHFRGPQVEFDNSRFMVKVEQNVTLLELELCNSMKDAVNDAPLWGLPARCIKLTNFTWDRKFFGTCSVYYTRIFEFESNMKPDPQDPEATEPTVSAWDKDLLDEGTKVLKGHWKNNQDDDDAPMWVLEHIDGADPDPGNPAHFIRFKDRHGENARVILNGAGLPAGAVAQLTKQFICVSPAQGEDQGLDDTFYWLPLAGTIDGEDWEADRTYPRGAVVIESGNYYVSDVNDNIEQPSLSTGNWIILPGPPTDSGDWDELTLYQVGEVVNDIEQTSAGRIHVEKYFERNFLLLNIPLTF